MLTREHVLVRYEPETGRVFPDRLTRRTHHEYLAYAQRMLRVYRNGIGRTRRELHRAVEAVFAQAPDCPARRIASFCKLLDEASVYQRDRRGAAAELRRQVFREAASRHPLVTQADGLFESDERRVKREIAAKLGKPWPAIEREIFADVIDFHRLRTFEGFPIAGSTVEQEAEALLARYNVAQVQATLYRATSLKIWARDDYKTIVRYAKLAGLMHTIRRLASGELAFHFDGPASVLRRTRRYGVAMARFLPALLACRGWRMQAVIAGRTSAWNWRLHLSEADGLHSHLPSPEEFDSSVEQAFFERWGSEPREGWTLRREGDLLYHGQKAFVPDFTFDHVDGRRVYLEIVGFWTPEYLEAKIKTLREFPLAPILVAAPIQIDANAPELAAKLAADVIVYKSALRPEDVLVRLHGFESNRPLNSATVS